MNKNNFFVRIYKDKFLFYLSISTIAIFLILGVWLVSNSGMSVSNGTNIKQNIISNHSKINQIRDEISKQIEDRDSSTRELIKRENKIDDDFFYYSKNRTIGDQLQKINQINESSNNSFNKMKNKSDNVIIDKEQKGLLSKILIARDEINVILKDLEKRITPAINSAKSKVVDFEKVVKQYCEHLKDCKYYKENENVDSEDEDNNLQIVKNNDFNKNKLIGKAKKYAMIGSKGYPNILIFDNPSQADEVAQNLTKIGDYSKTESYPYSLAGSKWSKVQNILIWAPKNSSKLSGLGPELINDVQELTVKDRGKKS